MLDLAISGRVALVTLNRPPANAIDDAWLVGFHRLLDGLAGRHDWAVLHLRSDQRIFCAGADLKAMRQRFEAPDPAEDFTRYLQSFQAVFARIEALPQVTLAEIAGPALGGGFELALSCDLRVASHEAKVGLPEARLGLIPGAGGTQRLTRLCGRATAARLMLGAEIVDGREAASLGMVQWAVPAGEIRTFAADLAARYAALPTHAVARIKGCMGAVADPARDGFAEEVAASADLIRSPETRALVAAFLESRAR